MSSVPASGLGPTRRTRLGLRLRGLIRLPPDGQLDLGGASHSWLLASALLASLVTLRGYLPWIVEAQNHWQFRPIVLLILDWSKHALAVAGVLAIIDARFRAAGPGGMPPPIELLLTALIATLVGWLPELVGTTVHVITQHHWRTWRATPALKFIGMNYLTLTALLLLVYSQAARGQRAAEALEALQVNEARLARELASARLQVLKAQIEPHFIFNVLANVRRLIRTDRRAADALLGDMLRYLEQALPALREESTSLGRERELVRAFLAIHQVRMGERLHYTIDIPDAFADQPLPAMALLTLVENALKHGLHPLVEGGRIDVTARRLGDEVVLDVADTGRGMGSGLGHGTGLANVRAQLRLMFGARASLQLSINEPRGVIATLRMPVQP